MGIFDFFPLIIVLGASLNFIVMTANGRRMPVMDYKNFEQKDNGKHFTFQNRKKIRLFFLADIIPIHLKKIIFLLSVGDVLVVVGFFGIIMRLI